MENESIQNRENGSGGKLVQDGGSGEELVNHSRGTKRFRYSFNFEVDLPLDVLVLHDYFFSKVYDYIGRDTSKLVVFNPGSFKTIETILKGKTENPGRRKVNLGISDEEIYKRYLELRSQGKGLRQLAKDLKVSYETIRARIKTVADNSKKISDKSS